MDKKNTVITMITNNQSCLYISMMVDGLGRTLGISDKKIGITQHISNRLEQLSNTKSPIQSLYLKLYVFEGPKTAGIVEKMLHTLLDPQRTEGEYFKDEDGSFVSRINSALFQLKKLGTEWQEVAFENDERLPSTVKDTIASNNRIYWDWDNIPDADPNNPEKLYSIWMLTSPSNENYYLTMRSTAGRCRKKKLTPETAMNYCNSSKFLRTVDYDITKLKAEFLFSSDNWDETKTYCMNNNLPIQVRNDYNKD